MINITSLPSISSPDRLNCEFDDYKSHATMEGTQVICDLPTSENIPPTPETQGEGILFAFNLIITYCEAVLSLPPLLTKQTDGVCLVECLKMMSGLKSFSFLHVCNLLDL